MYIFVKKIPESCMLWAIFGTVFGHIDWEKKSTVKLSRCYNQNILAFIEIEHEECKEIVPTQTKSWFNCVEVIYRRCDFSNHIELIFLHFEIVVWVISCYTCTLFWAILQAACVIYLKM